MESNQRSINLIVIHCSATASGKPLHQGEWGKPGYLNASQVINAWHAARGFKRNLEAVRQFNSKLPSIGYHFVIDLTGEVYTGRGVGEVGAHAQNFNAHSIGICLVGGAELEGRYTPAQWKSLQTVVLIKARQNRISLAMPVRSADASHPLGYRVENGVCGHRDLSPDKDGDGLIESFEWLKTCPGFDVSAWLASGMTPESKHIYEEMPA